MWIGVGYGTCGTRCRILGKSVANRDESGSCGGVMWGRSVDNAATAIEDDILISLA